VAEAFFSLSRGGRQVGPCQRLSASRTEPAEEPRGCWIAEAFRALAAGKKQWPATSITEAADSEDDTPKSALSTPRNLTPRSMGDAVSRLRSMGGWAWVAFA